MASQTVVVNGVPYKVSGSIIEAFRYQVDVTAWADVDAEAGDPDAQRVVEKRDAFLKAMPPRARWLLIHSCLQLAAHAALVQESK